MPLQTAGSVAQIVAASYDAVLAAMKKPENQWSESAFLRELERQGAMKRLSFGPNIEIPIDFAPNATAAVISSTDDLDTAALTKTDVINRAFYPVGAIHVFMSWSKLDEAKNSSENQKVSFVRSLIENAIESHDDLIEQTLFTTEDNLLGLDDLVTATDDDVVGGIDSGDDAFWRNAHDTYVDETDINAAMTSLYNATAKGSGSSKGTKLIVSGPDAQALYESTLQAQQRWMDAKEAAAGFKVIGFKDARYVFSQYGGDEMYFLNPKNYNLLVSRSHFRKKGETQEIENASGYRCEVFSALQAVTNNRSRLGVLTLNS